MWECGDQAGEAPASPKAWEAPALPAQLPGRAAGSLSSRLWGQIVPCKRRKGPKACQESGIFFNIQSLVYWELWQHLQVSLCPWGDSAPGSAPPPPLPGSDLEGAGILLSNPTNKLLLFQTLPRQELPAQGGIRQGEREIRQNTEGGAAELSRSTSKSPPSARR